jgi:hypothetical protein
VAGWADIPVVVMPRLMSYMAEHGITARIQSVHGFAFPSSKHVAHNIVF